MTAKEKFIGIILIIIGALPFLLKIPQVNEVLITYTWILPGEIIYQVAIIILGALLLIRRKPKYQRQRLGLQ